MKKNTVRLIIVSLALLISLLFVACGAASDNSMEGGKLDAAPPSDSGSGIDLELNGSISNPEAGESDVEYQRKIIKNASIRSETKDFDNAIKLLEELCANSGGYIESSNLYGKSAGYEDGFRNANYVLRIPADKFDDFNTSIGNVLNVTSSSSNAEEVTAKYYDIQSRIEVLELQKESLQKMYDNYTDYKDIYTLLELQDKLFSVIEEIESYKTQLRVYDSKVSYSTVTLYVSEVIDYTEVEEPTFIEKLGKAFTGGLDVFLTVCQGLLIAFVAAFPTLLAVGTVAGVIVFVVVKRQKAKKARDKSKDNK